MHKKLITKYPEKTPKFLKIAKIDHDAKAVALAKWSLWVKILKMHAKNRSKKHLIYIYYSPCKILSLVKK